jgi:hypothetical protein
VDLALAAPAQNASGNGRFLPMGLNDIGNSNAPKASVAAPQALFDIAPRARAIQEVEFGLSSLDSRPARGAEINVSLVKPQAANHAEGAAGFSHLLPRQTV